MNVHLNKEVAEMIKEMAVSQGMTEDEVVQKIIEWYFEDCNKEN